MVLRDGQSPSGWVDDWSLAAASAAVAVSVSLVPSDSSVVVTAAVVASLAEAPVVSVVSVDAVVLAVSVAAFAVAADRIAPPPKPATAPSASVPGIKIALAIFTRLLPFVVPALLLARMFLSCMSELGEC